MIITKPQDELIALLCKKIDYIPSPGMNVIANTDEVGDILGVVGYDRWTKYTVEIHAAGHGKWLSDDLRHLMFHYPFIEVGVNAVYAHMCSNNIKAVKRAEKLGLVEQCRLKSGSDDGDLIISVIYKDDWIKAQPADERVA